MSLHKKLPIEFTWIHNPASLSKSLVGSLYIGVRKEVSFDVLETKSSSKLRQLENELKCKIEDKIREELRSFLEEKLNE